MSRRNQAVVAAGFVVLGTLLGWSLVAGPPDPTAFKADDAIETLTVRLDVGTDGDALEEPVALDLGLGFPLWLHPIGRGEEPAPFGAVPQEASERWHVAAGSGATFTFRTTGDAGLDGLQVTPQLLAGVRVSDIARVGFASRGTNNWSIAGYEITVNGKPFASGKPTPNEADRAKLTELDGKVRQLTTEMKELRDLLKAGLATEADRNRLTAGETALKALAADKEKLTDPAPPNFKARDARDDARQKLAEILPALERLRADRADLADLVRARLATAEDRKRLDELTAQLRRLASDRARFEGQLDGRVAWFEDREFRSPWREAGPAVQSARVTLVTQTHTEADTQNFVYLRTGGRKYLLGSPTTPVTGTGGPQVFPLDLAAGPLTAADIRGWAVGMVGQPGRTGTAPDRWHPQRVVVEIDGRVVYDSESNDLDRRSLEAIRLIPPAHFDQAGTIVANSPVSREVFGWEAGKGAGLDPAGSALPLPPATDPTYPPVEPGAPGQPADMTVIVLPPDPMFPPLFPGEFLLPPDEFGLPGNWWFEFGWTEGLDWGPGPGGRSGGWGEQLADFLFHLWQQLGWLPEPTGQMPQVQSPQITTGWRVGDNLTITWQVVGDEAAVERYEVSLVPVRPDQANPYPGPSIPFATVARGVHTATAALGPLPAGVDVPGLFLAPVVTAVPVNLAQVTVNSQPGPARAICRAGTVAAEQPVLVDNRTRWLTVPPPIPPGAFFPPLPGAAPFPVPTVWNPLGIAPGPVPGGRAVYEAGPVVSHNAIAFDPATPGRHVVAQPQLPGDAILVGMRAPPLAGRRRLVAHLGFTGGAGASGTATARLYAGWYAGGVAQYAYDPVPALPGLPTTAMAADPMPAPLELVVDPADAPAGTHLRILVRFNGGPFDAAHPPALFGVRLIPEP